LSFDIPAITKKLKSLISRDLWGSARIISGVFPLDKPTSFVDERFDFILAYSVLQYTELPMRFVDETIKLLKPRGRVLFGDIPNVNKKGRFLSSEYGWKFDADYKGIEYSKLNKYKDQYEYLQKSEDQNVAINDQFLFEILRKYRSRNYNVYILPQPENLPFSHTREDLLVERL
jgi:SAM-dependent methyltransferase